MEAIVLYGRGYFRMSGALLALVAQLHNSRHPQIFKFLFFSLLAVQVFVKSFQVNLMLPDKSTTNSSRIHASDIHNHRH